MFNKKLKEEIAGIKDFLVKAGIAYAPSLLQTSSAFDIMRMKVERITLLKDRIKALEAQNYRLEKKFDALCELLSVQQVFPAPGIQLEKGNKTVTVTYE